MQGSVLYGPGDVRVEERPDPMIIEPTDAIIRLAATCVCGSDLWPYRGVETFGRPTPMCHEYCGIVEEVGREVSSPVSSSSARFSPRINLPHLPGRVSGVLRESAARAATGAQAPFLRVPLADGTLVTLPELPGDALELSLLATSDVLGTGWFAADAAAVGPGKTVVIVGDGAVSLLGTLSAKQLGAL